MRELHLNESHTGDTYSRLSSNSPGGLLFPRLESLEWDIHQTDAPLPFFRLFLSPRLHYVGLSTYLPKIPEDLLTPLVEMISLLPTSLEYLSLMCGEGEDELLNDAVSSFICRCGPSLRNF